MTALIGVAAVVLWTASTFAQAKPSFAGKWTRDAPAGGAPAAGGGGGQRGGGGGGGGFQCGMTCDITQDATGIKISRVQGEATITSAFVFVGESKNQQPGRGGAAPTDVVTKGAWDGNKLVLTTVRDMQGTAITSTQTLSIDAGKLTVTTTSSREGSSPQTATYTKG